MQNRRRWGAHRREISGERGAAQMAWLESSRPGNINETENHFLCKTYRRDKLISKNLLDTRLPTYLIPLFP